MRKKAFLISTSPSSYRPYGGMAFFSRHFFSVFTGLVLPQISDKIKPYKDMLYLHFAEKKIKNETGIESYKMWTL